MFLLVEIAVTAVWGHEDPVTVHLVINGETVETTPEHPFLTSAGTWVTADERTMELMDQRVVNKPVALPQRRLV